MFRATVAPVRPRLPHVSQNQGASPMILLPHQRKLVSQSFAEQSALSGFDRHRSEPCGVAQYVQLTVSTLKTSPSPGSGFSQSFVFRASYQSGAVSVGVRSCVSAATQRGFGAAVPVSTVSATAAVSASATASIAPQCLSCMVFLLVGDALEAT